MKVGWVLFLMLISMVNGFNHRHKQRALLFRQLQDLLDDDNQEFDLDRRVFDENGEEEQYMVLRTAKSLDGTATAIEITLQNHAAMNTRLRVLYIDANGAPGIAETGRLYGGQTKSVKIPVGAKNINVLVEKDLFLGTWRVAYKGTLTNDNQCIRITGVTLFSKIHSCK